MEQVEKKMKLLSNIKWAGFALGLLMDFATAQAFGEMWATVLGTIAACAFFLLCESGKRGVLCEHIVEDLQEAMDRLGKLDCIFEIKSVKVGLIVRVYFIKAGEMAPRYGKAILDAIAHSWYRPKVWITQLVDLDSEDELKEAELALNEELLQNLQDQKKQRKTPGDPREDARDATIEETKGGTNENKKK